MGIISAKYDQFTYFSMQLGDPLWEGKDILDFGGNIGNLLKDPNSTVTEERYWCVDVVNQAIEIGKARYPEAHWTFYDRYNFSYNPTGVANLEIPDLGQKFDYILAYSVFTNTRRSTMIDLVRQLDSLLKTDGTLAFTFIDPHITGNKGEVRVINNFHKIVRIDGWSIISPIIVFNIDGRSGIIFRAALTTSNQQSQNKKKRNKYL